MNARGVEAAASKRTSCRFYPLLRAQQSASMRHPCPPSRPTPARPLVASYPLPAAIYLLLQLPPQVKEIESPTLMALVRWERLTWIRPRTRGGAGLAGATLSSAGVGWAESEGGEGRKSGSRALQRVDTTRRAEMGRRRRKRSARRRQRGTGFKRADRRQSHLLAESLRWRDALPSQ